MTYIAKSPLVIVRDGAGADHFVYTDGVIPAGVAKETLSTLESEGHIAKVGKDETVEVESGPARPAEAGPGSAKEKWFEYAGAVGVTVADDASKDDIIAAVKSAGL